MARKKVTADAIEERLQALEGHKYIISNEPLLGILLKGKPPSYSGRFINYCGKLVLEQYLFDMFEAQLSVIATEMFTGMDTATGRIIPTNDFSRGQAHAILKMQDEIRLHAQKLSNNKKQKDEIL